MAQSVRMTSVVLEPAAQEVVRATANPPYPFQLAPEKGRAKLVEMQSGSTPARRSTSRTSWCPAAPPGRYRSESSSPGAPAGSAVRAAGWATASAPPPRR
ncbi:hypothetical protein [Plantactinospora veratri]